MEFLIVTGMSGAGKSLAINALEDIGFYCVDNLPPILIKKFIELCISSSDKIKKVAIVVDIRGKDIFGDMMLNFEELINYQDLSIEKKMIFLDADLSVLCSRYKQTRRKHPFVGAENKSTEEALLMEQKFLKDIKQKSDYIIDTSFLSAAQLREQVTNLFLSNKNDSMIISCMSFGFKHGIPTDADLVFDVRCLPNPFYVDDLKSQTGLDEPVREYVLKWEEAKGLIPHLMGLIDYLVPLYNKEGKSQLVVAIGCTGGKHRSVVFTELLHEHLTSQDINSLVNHRDIKK